LLIDTSQPSVRMGSAIAFQLGDRYYRVRIIGPTDAATYQLTRVK
jgi:hypothetical protein